MSGQFPGFSGTGAGDGAERIRSFDIGLEILVYGVVLLLRVM